jgi:branched-chain amino acid transport system permease protein
MTEQSGGPVETAPRPRTVTLAERFPIHRLTLLAVAVLVGFGVVTGSWKTIAQGGVTGAGWRLFLVFGIAQGSIYALIALGYSLVYGILLMINFAHGEVFMAGAFASYFVAQSLDSKGLLDRDPIPSLALLFLTAILVSMLVAVLLERVAYRPLRNAPRLVPLITAIGASLFLQYTFSGFFGSDAKGYPSVKSLNGTFNILGFPVSRTQVLTNINQVVVTTFAIGGILAGVAGVLFALNFSEVDSFMGFVPGIKAFTAAVLGGIGSVTGAAIGGLILGVAESIGPVLLLTGIHVPATNQLRDVVAFTILVLVLVFRPGGILGTGEPEKA